MSHQEDQSGRAGLRGLTRDRGWSKDDGNGRARSQMGWAGGR